MLEYFAENFSQRIWSIFSNKRRGLFLAYPVITHTHYM